MRRRPMWVAKDPVALKYFQMREEEVFVLEQLDGATSIDQIKARFERRFAPRRLDPGQLQAFLGRLHREGLVISQTPGQGVELLERRRNLVRDSWIEGLTNLLALRVRGVDPDRFLRALDPLAQWLFSPAMLRGLVLLVIAALTLVLTHFDTLVARLPDFQAFFSGANVLWLAVALGLAKVLHELGHAMTCRRFGGECHEIGLMFLVFTPCLYCNVSDAWMLPSKWRRVAVSAAGMAVEMVLASLATFVWWWTAPGLLNGLCLDLMFVCSVSTLLFNGNPLLRYDGYYILSDLIETPNLQEQSGRVVRRWLANWLFGLNPPVDRLMPDDGAGRLALYAVASTLYRLFVVVAVGWFLERVLKPYGLELLARGLALSAVVAMVVIPAGRTAMWIRNQHRSTPVKWGRFAIRASLVLAAIVGLMAIPLPHRINAPAILEPAEAKRVYVTVPGTLVEAVAIGQTVREGQTLARLENHDVDLELAKLEGLRDRQRLKLDNLIRQQGADETAAAQIPTATEALADLESRLAQRRRDRQRLTLVAPQAGTVLPPRRTPPHGETGTARGAKQELPSWSGLPLDPQNLQAYLDTGVTFCLIGDPQHLEVLAIIDQADVDLVQPGQSARIQLDELPGDTLSGVVTSVAELDLQVAPRELVVRGDIPTRIDETGAPRPLSASYQVRIALDAQSPLLRGGAPGRVKISTAPQSMAYRLWRYLQQTFQMRD